MRIVKELKVNGWMVRNSVSVNESRFQVVASHLWMDNFERASRTAYKCVKSYTIDGVFCHPQKKMQSVIIKIERNKYVHVDFFFVHCYGIHWKNAVHQWRFEWLMFVDRLQWNGIQSNTNVESFKTFNFINEEPNRQSKSIYRRFSTLSQRNSFIELISDATKQFFLFHPLKAQNKENPMTYAHFFARLYSTFFCLRPLVFCVIFIGIHWMYGVVECVEPIDPIKFHHLSLYTISVIALARFFRSFCKNREVEKVLLLLTMKITPFPRACVRVRT